MKQRMLYLVLGLWFVSMQVFAGTNGGVTGTVKDADGKRLQGATVRVIGTTKGKITGKDGTFDIQNIPAGNYEIKITFTGLDSYEKKVTISADQTTNLGTITLRSKVVQTKEITVSADRLNNAEAKGISDKVNSETMQGTAGKESAQQVALTTTGVLSTGGGISIRGGRREDTKFLIDDQDVSDPISGGAGAAASATGDIKYAPTPSKAATAEVAVIRGNASAEYGGTTAGVVNQAVKTGRTDRYEGFLGWRTDVPSLWGSAKNGLKAKGTLENTIDFGLGGPVPGLEGTTFFISAKYYADQYRTVNTTNFLGSGIDAKDIVGNSLAQIPDANSQVRNITGRIPIKLTSDMRLQIGGSWGLTTLSTGDWGWLYAKTPAMVFQKNAQTNLNDTIMLSTVPISDAHQNVLNNSIYSYYLRLNQELSGTSFYEATISLNNNSTETSRRQLTLGKGSLVKNGVVLDPSAVTTSLDKPTFFGGYKVVAPADDYILSDLGDKLIAKPKGGQGDKVLDNYRALNGIVYLDNDPKRPFTAFVPSNLTGYIEDQADASSTNNPYGLTGIFSNAGGEGVEFRSASFMQFKGNYQNIQMFNDVKHVFQAGVDVRSYTIRRYQNQLPWSSNPFYDVYDDRFGGDIYSLYAEERAAGSEPKKSMIGSVYLTDQIQYKGINFTPGIRIDGFDPKTAYALDPTNITSTKKDATFKWQISPRLFVSYPISDRSFFTIAYGIYTQVPIFSSLYDNITSVIRRGNVIISNPDLQPERTNQYNVSYSTQLSDNFVFDVAAYYKDIYSLTGLTFVPDNRTPYSLVSNGEYGNVRGAEFSFRRTLANNFEFTLNYTLQYAVGTSSSVGTNYGIILASADPFTGQKIFPLTESPLDYDRRHRINFNGGFKFGNGEGPTIAGMKVLQNSLINLTGVFQTGQPYTLLDLKGNQAGDYNAERYPSLWDFDLRLSRRIMMSDIISSLGSTEIELYVDVINLFNRVEPILVYTRTKDPDNDGVSLYRQQGEFPSGPWYKSPDANNPASISVTQYDRLGNRLYNTNSDINKDGVVTQYEQYQMYLQYVNDAMKRKTNYQYPRQVYFGVNIRF